MDTKKVCAKCGQDTLAHPRDSYCKPCKAAYMQDYARDHRERKRAAMRRYMDSHREEIKAKKKQNYAALSPEERLLRNRRNWLRSEFKIDLADYQKLSRAQNDACAICQKPCPSRRFLAVDHDHNTGKIRGLLCLNCNRALERLDNVPNWCELAQAYLSKPTEQLPESLSAKAG